MLGTFSSRSTRIWRKGCPTTAINWCVGEPDKGLSNSTKLPEWFGRTRTMQMVPVPSPVATSAWGNPTRIRRGTNLRHFVCPLGGTLHMHRKEHVGVHSKNPYTNGPRGVLEPTSSRAKLRLQPRLQERNCGWLQSLLQPCHDL